MDFDAGRFTSYHEDNRLEAKRARAGLPNSLWDSYSAMANTYGGVILLGVDENPDGSFATTGLKDVERLRKDFWNTINNRGKVSANLLTDDDVESMDVGGDVVLAVHVPRASRENRPVYVNGDMFSGTFRRNGEGDYHCARGEVLAMLRDQPEETTDMKVIEDMDLSVFDQETVHAYRNRHMAYRPAHVWEGLDDERYLERIGAARRAKSDGRPHPTGAGLLMFGEEWQILYEYPDYFLDYRESLDPAMRWTDRLQSSSGDWTGNLFDFFFRVYGKLSAGVKTPFAIAGDGLTRVDDTPVHRALREALANCLVNADFLIPRGVVIRRESNKIILENPGSIRTGRKQMLRGGVSDPRNKALMKMFNLIGIGERAGSGVPDIFATWGAQGWESPVVEEGFGPDRTILTLPLSDVTLLEKPAEPAEKPAEPAEKPAEPAEKPAEPAEKPAEPLSRRQAEILSFMDAGREYSADDIARLAGLRGSWTRQLLKQLVDMGRLTATAGTKNRRYVKP